MCYVTRHRPSETDRLTLLETLLAGGASPLLRVTGNDSGGRTPVELLLDCVARIDPMWLLPRYLDGILGCLTALCRSGAQRSADDRSHMSVVRLMSRLGRRCLNLRDELGHSELIASFISDALSILIRYGFDPNRKLESASSTVRGRRSSESSAMCFSSLPTGNILVEIVRLVPEVRSLSSDLDHVYRWITVCLRSGADPDIEPYPPSLAVDDVICHSQSCIFIKPASDVESRPTCALQQFIDLVTDMVTRGRQSASLTDDDDAAVERLLMVFYASMSHDVLFRILRLAAISLLPDPSVNLVIDDRVVNDVSVADLRMGRRGGPRGALARAISKIAFRPRSLKQIARVAVYVALGRRVECHVTALPLPTSLKRYLLDFE